MTGLIRKTALLAVFSLTAACGDDFQPAPGAAIAVEDLEGLIDAAVADMGLEKLNSIPTEVQEFEDPLKASPPGHAVRYRDAEGREVTVALQVAVDEVHADDLVDRQADSLKTIETRTWRLLAAPATDFRVAGEPCDENLDPDDDRGCAWQDRDPPGVGDSARALRNYVVSDSGYAAVAFARHDVLVVVMVRQYESGTPDVVADDVAEALDDEIKRALSQ